MELKQYAEYKDSNIQWLGKIPTEWYVEKIKFTYNIIPKTKISASEGDEEGKYPFFVSGEKIKFINEKAISGEYIIVGDGGSPNFKYYNGSFSYSDHCFLLKLEKNNPKFLYYFLIGNLKPIDELCFVGMGLKNLEKYSFNSFMWSFPNSNDEQTQIANYLDKKTANIDKTIEKDKELIKLLEEKRISLITNVVINGLDKNNQFKFSGLNWIGNIPEKYKLLKLGYMAFVTKLTGFEYTKKWEANEEGDIIALRGFNIKNGVLNLDDIEKISFELSKELSRTRLYKNNLVFPCTGTIGNIAIIDEDNKYHINQNIAKIHIRNKILPKFLMYFILSDLGKTQIKLANTSFTQPVFLISDIRHLKIITPNLIEQEKIINFLDIQTSNVDKTIEKVQDRIELLEEYKKSLIHHAVTGKIKIN